MNGIFFFRSFLQKSLFLPFQSFLCAIYYKYHNIKSYVHHTIKRKNVPFSIKLFSTFYWNWTLVYKNYGTFLLSGQAHAALLQWWSKSCTWNSSARVAKKLIFMTFKFHDSIYLTCVFLYWINLDNLGLVVIA